MREGWVNVVDVLKKIFIVEMDVMWEMILNMVILGLFYSVFGSDVFFYKDVFDIIIE